MAIRIPRPSDAGLGNVQRASGTRGGIGARREADTFSGEQMSQIGRAGLALADELQTRRDETALLEAQQAWNSKSKEWLDPQNGIFAQRNGDAMGLTDRIDEAAQNFAKDLNGQFKHLSDDGRKALEQFLTGEQQRIYERAASHELGQSYQYEQALVEAAIDDERDRAIASVGTPGGDTEFAGSLVRANGLAESWLRLQGIDPESDDPAERMLADSMLKGKRTEIVLATADAIAIGDPLQAAELIEDAAEELDQTAVTKWRQQNRSRIETAAAERDVATATGIDRAVAEGGAPIKHSTKVDMNLGPKRPFEPSEQIVNVVGVAAQDILGPGARVEVFSGKDDSATEGENASARHYSGNAVDVRFFRPDGSQVKINDPEFPELALAAANRGALGIGFGIEYMGNAMHVDMFEKSGSGPYGKYWGSGAKAMGAELVSAMDAAEGLASVEYSSGWEYIMGIEDDGIRAKAIQRYNQQAKFQRDQMQIVAETTANDLVAEAIDIKNEGGSVDVQSMIEAAQGRLGPLTAPTYERLLAVAEGRMIQGDTNTFNDLWEDLNTQPERWLGDNPIDIAASYGHVLNTEQIRALESRRRGISDQLNAPNVGPDERGIGDTPLWTQQDLDSIINSATYADDEISNKERGYYERLAYEALDSYQRAQISAGQGRPSIDDMERLARRYITGKMAAPRAAPRQWFSGADPAMKEVMIRDRIPFYETKGIDFLLGEEAIAFSTPNGSVNVGNSDIRNAYEDWKQVYGVEPQPTDVLMLLQFRADRAAQR